MNGAVLQSGQCAEIIGALVGIDMNEVTRILSAVQQGDQHAAEQLPANGVSP